MQSGKKKTPTGKISVRQYHGQFNALRLRYCVPFRSSCSSINLFRFFALYLLTWIELKNNYLNKMTSQSDKKVTFVLNVHQFQLVVNFSISQGKGYYELRLI